MYAIVDIETTGGHAASNGITEIAVILHDGHVIEGSYHTLVNPGYSIPKYISALTGITDAMVADAPSFSDIAEKVQRLLDGRIFVAHNVNFDFSFIRHHLSASGFDFTAKKVCTVRLSRKVFKGLPSYSLGKLCRSLEIEVEHRHRAMGDAQATVRLFEKLLAGDAEGHLQQMLKMGSREGYLPIHLDASQIDGLPSAAGIYYFHDAKDKVIYVGKAIDLKKRVVSHFSGNGTTRRRQEFLRKINRISFQECGSALVASLMESIEIKRLWPVYNQSQKNREYSFGIYPYEDQRGVIRLGLEYKRKNLQPVVTISTITEGHTVLRNLLREFNLCPKHCTLQRGNDRCIGVVEQYCKGVCEDAEDIDTYNRRVLFAIEQLKTRLPSFVLLEHGRHAQEQAIVLVEDGLFVGMGFLAKGLPVNDRALLMQHITPYPGNELIRSLVLREAELHPEKIIYFS